MFTDFQDKSLLAFSGGPDSVFLFHKLVEEGKVFDIAIVDYGLREQSKEEVAYAKALSDQHGITCFVKSARSSGNFSESMGRKIRYDFFRKIVEEGGYSQLLTGHQLNDQIEWLFMQMSKGAGLTEMLGLKNVSVNRGLKVVRPILNYSKDEVLEYLDTHSIQYFIDESNNTDIYTRNKFRNSFVNEFVSANQDGIKKSLSYLNKDKSMLESNLSVDSIQLEDLYVANISGRKDEEIVRIVDKSLKERGIVMTNGARQTLLKDNKLEVGSSRVNVLRAGDFIYIYPKETGGKPIPKEVKSVFKTAKIPPGIRKYIYKTNTYESLLKFVI